jgi:hypothetical protein
MGWHRIQEARSVSRGRCLVRTFRRFRHPWTGDACGGIFGFHRSLASVSLGTVKALPIYCSGAALILLFAGCAKKPEAPAPAQPSPAPARTGDQVALVRQAERSSHFEDVNANLELGGVLYGYVDIDGDALDLAKSAEGIVHQLAVLQPSLSTLDHQDLKALFSDLGLNDIKAVGVSSVREASGTYRNRAFLYTPDGRHGFLAVLGGQPATFEGAKLAPSDCDFYTECEFNVGALYGSIRTIIERAAGPDQASAFDKKILGLGAQAGFSALDFVKGLKGRLVVIVRTDPHASMAMPSANGRVLRLPAIQAVLRVTGIGSAMESIFERDASFAGSMDNGRHLFKPKKPSEIQGLDPVIETDGETFYYSTSPAFLAQCLAQKAGLDTNPLFAEQLAQLGPDGNGLTWVSPRFFESLRSVPSLNSDAPAQFLQAFTLLAGNLPAIDQPLFSIRSNLPKGILVRSNWYRSLKANLALFTIYNPVTLGLVSAMAIPAIEKVKQNARVRAASVPGNGSPSPARPVAPLPQGVTPPQSEGQTGPILANLKVLSEAADKYYADHGVTTTTLERLMEERYIRPPVSTAAGEDYRTVLFKKGRPLRLFLKDGRIITYPPADQ